MSDYEQIQYFGATIADLKKMIGKEFEYEGDLYIIQSLLSEQDTLIFSVKDRNNIYSRWIPEDLIGNIPKWI